MASENDLNKLILILRRATGIALEMTKEIASLFAELRKAIDLDNTISENVNNIKGIVNSSSIKDDLISKLMGVSVATMAINPELKPIRVTKKLIDDALSIVMSESNITTKDMIDRTIGLTKTSVVNFTYQAHENGWTNKQLQAALKTSEAQIARHIATIARTSVNAVSNETKRRLFKANNETIDRVLFSATLDSRTSNICKSLDGKAFKLDDAPQLPLHPNERSQLLPILVDEDPEQVKKDLLPRPAVEPKNKAEYDDKGLYTNTGKTRRPSRTDRSPLKGVQSQSENYEVWLRKQPAYYQDDIIGKESGKKFRSGSKLTDVIEVSPITEDFLNKAIN